MKSVARQILVVVSLFATLTVNALANILPFNNLSTGEISDSFPVRFVPAGYVFAIWGVIYLSLLVYAVYQALPAQRNNPKLNTIGWLFVLSNVFNSIWIFTWHYLQFWATQIMMLGLLVSLIAIYLQLGTGRTPAANAGEKWLVRLPFSIYLAWGSVATIANTTILLYDLGWNGQPLSPDIWAAVMLVVGAALTGIIIYTRNDVAFVGVIVWAYIGIVVAQGAFPLVAGTAGVLTLVVVAALIANLIRQRQTLSPA